MAGKLPLHVCRLCLPRVDQLGDKLGIVKRVGQNVSLRNVSSSWSEYTIQFVQGNIDGINEAVKSEGAIIDDDFKATIYFASSRARGQSKIETWATGAVLVYMNNEQADDLYNALANVHPLTILANMLSKLTKAQSILGQACRIAAFVANLQVVSYKAQIGQVKSNGTGIIMYVIPLPDGIASTANFGAQ